MAGSGGRAGGRAANSRRPVRSGPPRSVPNCGGLANKPSQPLGHFFARGRHPLRMRMPWIRMRAGRPQPNLGPASTSVPRKSALLPREAHNSHGRMRIRTDRHAMRALTIDGLPAWRAGGLAGGWAGGRAGLISAAYLSQAKQTGSQWTNSSSQ